MISEGSLQEPVTCLIAVVLQSQILLCPPPPRFERLAGPNPCTLHAVEQIVNVRGWQRKIPKRPVLQVVSVEAINCARSSFEVARNPQGRTDGYQCGLSDSIRYHAQFTIHPRLNHLIHDG